MNAPVWSQELATYLPELQRRALRLARSQAQADDLVQDTMLRALAFAHRFSEGTNLRGWLHQILFSIFISDYRKRGRERRALSRMTHDPSLTPTSSEPEHTLPLTPSSRSKVLAMPPAYRSVLELVDLGDCSYREAASQLQLPLGTVMSRLHRGRKLLASMFEADRELAAAA